MSPNLGTSYLGLSAATLSQFVGVPCVGLLGADVLGRFDHIFDTAGGRLTVSTAELSHSGASARLEEFMGIPIVTARVGSSDYRMFFDTGAQISYFQDDSLTEFPSAGSVTDLQHQNYPTRRPANASIESRAGKEPSRTHRTRHKPDGPSSAVIWPCCSNRDT